MGRPANGNCISASSNIGRNLVNARQHKCERSRPEGFGQSFRQSGKSAYTPPGHGQARHVHDERVVGGAALNLKNLRDRIFIQRIGREPVNRFRWQSDHLASAQENNGPLDSLGKQLGSMR